MSYWNNSITNSRAEYTEEENRLLRIAEIKAILVNNLYNTPEEHRELVCELSQLQCPDFPTKNLVITIRPLSNSAFCLEIYEPESGEYTEITCHDTGDTIEEENRKIINEIRSLVSLLRDNIEGMEEK